MFVKKDLRKIPNIISDASSRAVDAPPDSSSTNPGRGLITDLTFARRASEFLPIGNIAVLLQPAYQPAFNYLIQLSLYDCGLKSLSEVQKNDDNVIYFPKLQHLDVGRNPLLTNDSLSNTFHTHFPSLLEIWCDNCSFGPSIPSSFLQMHLLQVVRLTGNKLRGELETGIGRQFWKDLTTLALDGNGLDRVGDGIGLLPHLEKLQLRQNKLVSLPDGMPSRHNSNLVIICLSSNRLSYLPNSLVNVGPSLRELHLNANCIQVLPHGLGDKLTGLVKLNLAHNRIGEGLKQDQDAGTNTLPADFIRRFGMPDPLGKCSKDDSCTVLMEGNPLAELRRVKSLEIEREKNNNPVDTTAMEVVTNN